MIAGGLALGVMVLGGWTTGRRAAERARAEAIAASALETRVRAQDIAFFRARVAGDPYGAGDRAQLASLLLSRARATGSYEDLVSAEGMARASLALRRNHNRAGALVLANSLMAQHRFLDALPEAEQLVADDSTDVTALSLTGEVLLELGRYGDAARRFSRIGPGPNLAATMRLARWRELTGDIEGSWRMLLDARQRSRRVFGLSVEQRAWFELRIAEFALRYGHLREADDALSRGFRITPDDHRLLTVAAKVALAGHDWMAASDLAGRALERHFDPATLTLLAQAERGRGNDAAAAQAVEAMVGAIRSQPGAWHRAWSLALIDEGRELEPVLERSRQELKERQDIYGWDLYAWALHRTGDELGARDAMAHALATGTRDPQILAHAAAIGAGAP